jgi:peroxiredoxin
MKFFAPILLITLCAFSAVAQNNLRIGSPAPEFAATDLNGNNVALSELRGNVVVITFWSTRCPICHEEFPKFNRVVKSFEGKRVKFLSLTNDSEAKVENYLRNNQLASTILPNSFGIMLQYADHDKSGNVDIGFPAYFVVGPDGKIEYRGSGWDKTQPVASTIDRALNGL